MLTSKHASNFRQGRMCKLLDQVHRDLPRIGNFLRVGLLLQLRRLLLEVAGAPRKNGIIGVRFFLGWEEKRFKLKSPQYFVSRFLFEKKKRNNCVSPSATG